MKLNSIPKFKPKPKEKIESNEMITIPGDQNFATIEKLLKIKGRGIFYLSYNSEESKDLIYSKIVEISSKVGARLVISRSSYSEEENLFVQNADKGIKTFLILDGYSSNRFAYQNPKGSYAGRECSFFLVYSKDKELEIVMSMPDLHSRRSMTFDF